MPELRRALRSLFRSQVLEAKPYIVDHPEGIHTKLNQNESPFDVSDRVKKAVLGSLSESTLNRYPSPQPDLLRLSLAEYAGVPPDAVLVTHGSNEFVHSLCVAFVEPGKTVVLPTPMFALFGASVRLFGGTVVEVESLPTFDYDLNGLIQASKEHSPALTVLACPNNPTGKDLTIKEIETVVASSKGFVVVDEAYWEFSNRASAADLIKKYDNIIVLRTLSKAFGLAGLRIGYVVADPDVIVELMKVRLPFMVEPFAEKAAICVLEDIELVRARSAALRKSQESLASQLLQIKGVEVVPSVTNFIVFKTDEDSFELLEILARKGVLVRDMAGYRQLAGFLRVNVGTEDENNKFIIALKSALESKVPG